MKKGIAIGLLSVASFMLLGCQQPQPSTTTPDGQKASTTATVKINEGQTATSTGSLELLPPPTQQTTTGSLEIKPAPGETATKTVTPPVTPVPPVAPVPPVVIPAEQ